MYYSLKVKRQKHNELVFGKLKPKWSIFWEMLECDVLMYAQHSDAIGQFPKKQGTWVQALAFVFPQLNFDII